MIWREDQSTNETPTNTIVVIVSTDVMKTGTDHYYLSIHHVHGYRGKGFMPVVKFNSGLVSGANGDVHYGTNQDAYDKAEAEGRSLMAKKEKKFAEGYKKLLEVDAQNK